ncbi:phosphopantetheine-binding protein [Paracoccus jiaweipingae]|uniref:phosphopantetheine-binding protein n=1 Tax=unclassified Paracoccus (in: a-proteobacteria) TaxID=2688777 RepID=UPI0037AD4138
MTQTPPDRDWLNDQIAAMTDPGDAANPDDNLIMHGLDSIRVMAFAGRLHQRGISVSFEDLITQPTANAWWALIQARQNAATPG